MRISDWSSDVCLPCSRWSPGGIPAARSDWCDGCAPDPGSRHQRASPVPAGNGPGACRPSCRQDRSEEHTSELQSLMRISYAVFCLKKKTATNKTAIGATNEHQKQDNTLYK